jgi:hypothetical protein
MAKPPKSLCLCVPIDSGRTNAAGFIRAAKRSGVVSDFSQVLQ